MTIPNYFISDDELARRLGVDRRSVVRLIRNYHEMLVTYGKIIREKVKQDNGSPIVHYNLETYQQYCFVIMIVKNTEKSIKLKQEILEKISNA